MFLGEAYIRLANAIGFFQGINRSMHIKIEQISIEWGACLIRIDFKVRDYGRFEEYAFARG